MKNRIEHVDIAKGISIILVALYHSNLYGHTSGMLDSMNLFRIPLFFFLSGLFFSFSTDTYTFLQKKSDALLKPYFVTSLIVFFLAMLIKNDNSVLTFLGIFYGNADTIRWGPMWFLTHLFAIYFFTYFIFKFTNIQEKKVLYKYIFLIMLITIGINFIDIFWHLKVTLFEKEIIMPGLPFSFDVVLISSSFFIAGVFLKKMIINFNPNLYILFISAIIFLTIAVFSNAAIDLNARTYINPIVATAGSACGIYIIIWISFFLNKTTVLRNIFLTFGQASLFILIFHYTIDYYAYKYFLGKEVSDSTLLLSIITFLISITVPVLIKIIVSKSKFLSLFYFPLNFKKS